MSAPEEPGSFAAGRPLGIIAGGGDLPRLVAERAAASGWTPILISVGDGIGSSAAAFEQASFAWNAVGDAFPFLRRRGVGHVVFCGTVSVRPDFRRMVPTMRTLALLPEILRVVRGGDDALLRATAHAFERRGFTLLAVHDLVPELLMPLGRIAGDEPDEDASAALLRARRAASRLGELDVGQAVVASKDRVIALEGIEGTREMLRRVADLRKRGRIGSKERCVLFKGVKPQQDLRFDLPSVGAATVEEAAAAGLVGIGLSAGRSLVIEMERVLEAARTHRLFLVGLDDDANGKGGS